MELGSPDPLASHDLMDSEITSSALVMHDPFNNDPFEEISAPSGSKNKRKATCEPDPEERKPNTTRPRSQIEEFENPSDCILGARDLLIKAAHLEQTRARQTKILDLLNIFREFMENDGNTHRANTILSAQVQRLEQTAQILQTSVQRANNANRNGQQPMGNNTQPNLHQNTGPNVRNGSRPGQNQPNQQNQTNQNTNQAPRTWANIASAARGNQNQNAGEWIEVQPKKRKAPSKPRDANRIILLLDEHTRSDFSALAFRDRINQAYKSRGVQGPVVALVSKTRKDNIAVVTTPSYTAEYMLQNRDIWRNAIPHVEAFKDEEWYKVVVHGVPVADFPNPSDLSEVIEEIETFNQGLKVIGQPYWITPQEKFQTQMAGSIVVAFETEAEAKLATNKRLIIAGLSLKAEKFHNIPASTQCNKCQRFGHLETNCRWEANCRYCAGPHNTRQHCCTQCRSIGVRCVHLVPKCSNCTGAHTADYEGCETKFSILTRQQTMDDSEEL